MNYLITYNPDSEYLQHFNPRHNPKTGRFDFALPGERKEVYGGNKRSEYVKNMSSRYQEEGYSKGKSRRLAGYAARSNKLYTQQYNNNLRQYQNMQKKALTDYDKHDEEKYNKHVTKLIESYKWAKINDELLSKDYEMGKALYEPLIVAIANDFTFGGAIPGAIKGVADLNKRTPNKWTNSDSQGTLLADARRKVTNEMTSDYITKHPKEALDKAIAISKLEKFLYGDI